jgi:hypothetical protein
MSSIRRDSILKAGIAAVAFAVAALALSPIARAQAMGEYGAVTGEAAGAASQAPHANLPALPTAQHDSSGTTTTVIKEDDSSPEAAQAADKDSGQSGDEWTEVHGTGDDDQPGN